MIVFRDLTASEVECRVASVHHNSTTGRSGLQIIIYKDARVDMSILDHTVGPENWQREHYTCNDNVYCKIGIKCNDEWVWKSDCGAESNAAKEKGESSDSFKRAGINWGIGRELYTAPFIWIDDTKCNIVPSGRADKNGKPVYECKDKFEVSLFTVQDKKIVELDITNTSTNRLVFSYRKNDKRKVKKLGECSGDWSVFQKCSHCGATVKNDYADATIEKLGKVYCPDCIAAIREVQRKKKNETAEIENG